MSSTCSTEGIKNELKVWVTVFLLCLKFEKRRVLLRVPNSYVPTPRPCIYMWSTSFWLLFVRNLKMHVNVERNWLKHDQRGFETKMELTRIYLNVREVARFDRMLCSSKEVAGYSKIKLLAKKARRSTKLLKFQYWEQLWCLNEYFPASVGFVVSV